MTDLRDDDTRTNRLGDLVRDITGSIPRSRTETFERTRTHHVVSSRPEPRPNADPIDDWAPLDHWLEPEPNRPRRAVDPTLLRLGAVAAAGLLMIPLALALREDEPSLQADQPSVTTIAPQALAAPPTTVALPSTVAPAPVAALAAPVAEDEQVAAAAAVSEEPVCAGTYVVIANDFWNRFPATSGASVAEWLAANGATADTPLYVGDELCIPAGAAAPAPPPPTTAAPTTAVPATAAATVPAPTQTAAAPAAPAAPVVAVPVVTPAPAPPPPAPVATAPPAAIPAGAASTDGLCGALPTSNGNPGGTPGPAQVEALIREIWPDDVEVRALCIAKREARLRADLNNWCCYGVFALYFDYIPADLKATFGVDAPADLYDARTNIAIAYQIYLRGGWKPWSQTDPGSG